MSLEGLNPGLLAKWFISIIASILKIGPVFEFLFCGQLEHVLADGELAVYLFLGQAEVDDVEEA